MSERCHQPMTEGLWTFTCAGWNKILLLDNRGETWVSERNALCEPPPPCMAPAQAFSVKSMGSLPNEKQVREGQICFS